MVQMSVCRYEAGDYDGAFRYISKPAELGDAEAHFQLAMFYHEVQCVEKDRKKEVYHLEQAAIGGHAGARYNLAIFDLNNDKGDRAMKHFLIAATLGHDASLGALRNGFRRGLVSKEDFASALRAHQAAAEATKSPQREAAEEAEKV